MLLIDDRIGSKELSQYIPKHIEHRVCRLDYGDVSFLGNGPEDSPVCVGIERKRLTDLLSSMQSGRLSGHQLRGMLSSYHVVYLVVEGIWRANPGTGVLEHIRRGGWSQVLLGKRGFTVHEVESYLNTLTVMGGVLVRESRNDAQTAGLAVSLYKWWGKPWEEHRSHLALHKRRVRALEETTSLGSKPSLVRRVASELEGIEWKISQRVEERFGSVLEMALAEEEEWREIRGIGKEKARRAVGQMRGET